MPGTPGNSQTIDLRYGENPYQKARLVLEQTDDRLAVGKFKQLSGREGGYINYTDLDRAIASVLRIVAALGTNTTGPTPYVAAANKHGNLFGAGVGSTPAAAVKKMINSDRESIFGGTVILTFDVDYEIARLLTHYRPQPLKSRPLDALIAPLVTDDAAAHLERKEGKCRILENPALSVMSRADLFAGTQVRHIRGGRLEQDASTFVLDLKHPQLTRIGRRRAAQTELNLAFAAAICATSNSNTITIVKNGMLLGQGLAQTSRKRAAQVAVFNAKESGHEKRLKGSVAASDSFFPFDDAPKVLMEAGVETIYSTTGSVRDKEVQDACRAAGVTLYQLPDAIGRLFSNH